MNNRIARIILLALFALCVGVTPVVIASTGHEAAAPEMQTENSHQAAAPQAGEMHGAAAEGAAEAVTAHGEGGEGGHGEAHVSKSITPEKLKDLFWRTVNFIALLIILIKFLAKPIGSGLTGRQQRVKEEIENLQAKRDKAERAYKQFEAKLAGMEKEMEVVVEKAIAQAQVEKTKILAEADKAAGDIRRQAEAAVQAEIVEARKTLRQEIAEKAGVMAEELIVKNLTPEDQIKITEQYLNRVGAVQ